MVEPQDGPPLPGRGERRAGSPRDGGEGHIGTSWSGRYARADSIGHRNRSSARRAARMGFMNPRVLRGRSFSLRVNSARSLGHIVQIQKQN
jgi:hypothetical protein